MLCVSACCRSLFQFSNFFFFILSFSLFSLHLVSAVNMILDYESKPFTEVPSLFVQV